MRRLMLLLERFCPLSYPENLLQALVEDTTGLPITTTLHFWSIIKSTEECLRVGGGIGIYGKLPRAALLICESGLQEFEKQRNVLQTTGDQHEPAVISLLPLALQRSRLVSDSVDFSMETLPLSQQEATSNEHVLVGAESSWQPGCVPGSENHVKGTPTLMEAAFGEKGEYWRDSNGHFPHGSATNPDIKKCYDGKHGFSDQVLEDAMDEKDSILMFVSINGGAWMIDEDKVNMRARDCMPFQRASCISTIA